MLLVVDSLEQFVKDAKECKVRIAVEEGDVGEEKVGKITLTLAKLTHVVRLDIFIKAKDGKELGVDMDSALKEITFTLEKSKIKYSQGVWYP